MVVDRHMEAEGMAAATEAAATEIHLDLAGSPHGGSYLYHIPSRLFSK